MEEAQAAQSRKDFISKMSIASKEARESKYRIRLLETSGYLKDFVKKDLLISEANALTNILTKIVKTSKLNVEEK